MHRRTPRQIVVGGGYRSGPLKFEEIERSLWAVGVEITYDFTRPESNRLFFWVFKVCCTAIAVAHTEGVNDRFAAFAADRWCRLTGNPIDF